MSRSLYLTIVLFSSLVLNIAVLNQSRAAIINVDSTLLTIPTQTTPTPTDGLCTFYEALFNALDDNQLSADCAAGNGDDEIILAAGDYEIYYMWINLSSAAPNGSLTLTGQPGVTLDYFSGTSSSVTTFIINGSSQNASPSILTIKNLSIKGMRERAIRNYGQLTLDNVNFSNITAASSSSCSSIIYNKADVTVNNSSFDNLINIKGIDHQGSSLIVNNTVFSNMSCNENGVGISASNSFGSSNIVISNSTFYNLYSNTQGKTGSWFGGAAIYIDTADSATISGSKFFDNYAYAGGGAIYLRYNGTYRIERSVFYNNSTDGNGGALVQTGGTLNLANSLFSNNTAVNTAGLGVGNGGAIYRQGRLLYIGNRQPTITSLSQVTIVNNTAFVGGGIHSDILNDSGLRSANLIAFDIENSIIENNSAVTSYDCKGPLYSQGNNFFGSDILNDGCEFFSTSSLNDSLNTAAGLDNINVNMSSSPAASTVYLGLLSTSPALDVGNPSDTNDINDFLNIAPLSSRDSGAFEFACGDGFVSVIEACDDGNTDNTDGCTEACQLPRCGDGYIQSSNAETCDDGNTLNNDGCSSSCEIEICGDGTVQVALGEQCDDGNLLNNDGCDEFCEIETVCGNGIIEGAEACDDGNTGSEDGCSNFCLNEICGDGVLQVSLGENCDDGNTSAGDGCNTNCQIEVCGDGVQQASETCDDGNTISNDGCSSVCQSENCGDGIQQNSEQCDDGNLIAGDGCNASCQSEYCGDGLRNLSLGEDCDDGNGINDDDCTNSCLDGRCGDGIVKTITTSPNKFAIEQCDDGNSISGDGCDDRCQYEVICGDGIRTLAEQCDDGNTQSNDGCSSGCLIEALRTIDEETTSSVSSETSVDAVVPDPIVEENSTELPSDEAIETEFSSAAATGRSGGCQLNPEAPNAIGTHFIWSLILLCFRFLILRVAHSET